MALGKKCRSGVVHGEERLGFVKYTRRLGSKRIVISNDFEDSCMRTPLKKQRSQEIKIDFERLNLESLPQDILIRVLCGVNHNDLKRLIYVSKSIRDATLIAKEWHFAYTTPSKTRVFPKSINFENASEFDEIEAPNAPKQSKHPKSRITGKKFSDISIALFTSPDQDQWPKTGVLFDTKV